MNEVMIETEKLYDKDAYMTEFDATVVSCEEAEYEKQTAYKVVLDQTLFFPEEGGQTPDKGTINGIKVLDVQTKKGIITHTLEAPLEKGEKVHGTLDFTHRFSNMQQHSGEHIFSGLVHEKYGYDNVGFHLSDQVVTMDFNGVLTWEQALEIEQKANEVIISNLEVQVSYPSKQELSKLDYRSKIEIDGQVRIVTIPNVDVCACCAPHVRRTGEIGMLKLISLQNYKGGVRLSILCGFRALEDYRKKAAILTEVSLSLSTNQEALPETVAKLKSVNQSLKSECIAAKQECMEAKLDAIDQEQEDVILFENALDSQIMRTTVNKLVTIHTGICAIFTGNDKKGYSFIIGSKEKDVRELMNSLKESFGAKGGGSAAMVQGSLTADKDEIMKLF